MSIGDFVDELIKHSVQTVIDTRQNRMYQALAYNGRDLPIILGWHEIAYKVVEDLAPSKELRENFHRNKHRPDAFDIFLTDYLNLIKKRNILDEQSALSNVLKHSNRIALLCTEEHYGDCHRSVAADYLHTLLPSSKIVHICKPNPKRDPAKTQRNLL